MSSGYEVSDYLELRAERIKRKNPILNKKIEEIQRKKDRAIEKPSEVCKEGAAHNFILLSHSDTKDVAIYYFCCNICDEVFVTKQVRTEDDPMGY